MALSTGRKIRWERAILELESSRPKRLGASRAPALKGVSTLLASDSVGRGQDEHLPTHGTFSFAIALLGLPIELHYLFRSHS